MSSRTKLAIIISSVLLVVVSLVVCVILVKGLPDVNNIKSQMEGRSFASVTVKPKPANKPETTNFPPSVSHYESEAPTSSTGIGTSYLTSISISSPPDKTDYYVGDTFSTVGMVVTASYSDGSSGFVTGSTEKYPNMYTVGTQQVTVSYADSYGNKKYDYFVISITSPSISVTQSSLNMEAGDTYYNLSCYSEPQGLKATWKSSSPNVASVDSNGNVSALNEGTAYITASITYNGKVYTSSSCKVYVEEPETEVVTQAPSTLSINDVDWFEWSYYDNVLWFTHLTGYVSSNYYLEYVRVGIEGPVYINGEYDTIDQYYTFEEYEINSKRFTLDDHLLYLDFDYIQGEEYLFYVYAEDSSGESQYYECYVTFD